MVMINYFMWIGMIQVSNTHETMEGDEYYTVFTKKYYEPTQCFFQYINPFKLYCKLISFSKKDIMYAQNHYFQNQTTAYLSKLRI